MIKKSFTYLSSLFLLSVSCFIQAQELTEHQRWLKDQFADKHQALIPVVAVADMFYGCNQSRKSDPVNYQIKDLVLRMERNLLAEKLSICLADDTPKSDAALNFGLYGCFTEQLKALPKDERQAKMDLVEKAIAKLSREQRQKSFTQCVTDQAVNYIR